MGKTDFHRKLRLLQEQHNLSCVEFAEKIGVTPSTLSFYRKDREPSYDVLLKICDVFHTTPNWLLGYIKEDDYDVTAKDLLNRLKEIERLANVCTIKKDMVNGDVDKE